MARLRGRHAAALHEQLAIRPTRTQETERSVTDAANHAAGRIGLADLSPQRLGLTQVERGAPSAGSSDAMQVGREGEQLGELVVRIKIAGAETG